MTRQRDDEALAVAREIAEQIHASPEAKQTGVLIGARAYRRGVNEGFKLASKPVVEDVEREGRTTKVVRREPRSLSWARRRGVYRVGKKPLGARNRRRVKRVN